MSRAKKVLIVNAELKNRISYGNLFEEFGFEVVQAKNGGEAVQIYEEDPSYDLIVVDINLPGMNGFTAAKLIRQYQMAKRPYIVGVGAPVDHNLKSSHSGIDFFVVSGQGATSTKATLLQFPLPA